MSYLLDTCVLSELVSKKPNANVVRWIDDLDPDKVYLSVLTLGEIEKGIGLLPKSRRREALTAWLQNELLVRFRDSILPLDLATARTWGRLIARLEKDGATMPAVDSLLAATALHHSLILVTRNVVDFETSEVELFDPWSLSSDLSS